LGYIETDIEASMKKRAERIERRVKLHDLRVLMSVVERGSMAKAAESLATSQPAISRAIADLEYSLGVCLLDRGPRGIVPTPYGHALISRACRISNSSQIRRRAKFGSRPRSDGALDWLPPWSTGSRADIPVSSVI
jgi:DNA-binding transcriptional LysR family regulator